MTGKVIRGRPTWYWKFYVWWLQITKNTSITTASVFYGGVIHITMFFERPCGDGDRERLLVASSMMTLAQAEHFHAELGNQIERMKAFGGSK